MLMSEATDAVKKRKLHKAMSKTLGPRFKFFVPALFSLTVLLTEVSYLVINSYAAMLLLGAVHTFIPAVPALAWVQSVLVAALLMVAGRTFIPRSLRKDQTTVEDGKDIFLANFLEEITEDLKEDEKALMVDLFSKGLLRKDVENMSGEDKLVLLKTMEKHLPPEEETKSDAAKPPHVEHPAHPTDPSHTEQAARAAMKAKRPTIANAVTDPDEDLGLGDSEVSN